MKNNTADGKPLPIFSVLNTVAVTVGIVIGIGIFRLPPIVAANSGSEIEFILFWVAGGVISLLGALCYGELASLNPDAGGEYHFLNLGYGPAVGFLFSWGRMTVIQTGSIALAAFILGDYATLIFDLGAYSSAIYAGLTVVFLTGLNILGTLYSKRTQDIVTVVVVLMLVVTAIAGFFSDGSPAALSSGQEPVSQQTSAGFAMIFVLLTYGGWNEAVYLSAELKNVRKNMVRVLLFGIGIITAVYVSINYAYLHVLGLDFLQNAEVVGVDLTGRLFGSSGALIMALIVIVAALSTANATIITGARTNYALGRDFDALGYLGKWNKKFNAPRNALIVQGAIALALVIAGSVTKEAVTTMVEYTAPVFWFFLLLTTATLFLFRKRNKTEDIPFKVPFYPVTPILFILVCLYMLYSSLNFTGVGAFVGVGILLLGFPVFWYARNR